MSMKPSKVIERQITINGMPVQVVHKAIKNLHLSVLPPHGKVRVAAPLALHDDAVRLAVITRLSWIKRQQAKFEAQPRQSRREMISGETHYFLGQRYRLNIIEATGPSQVSLRKKTFIDLHVRPHLSAEQRETVLAQWYREQLRNIAAPMLEKWQQKLDVQIVGWGIKKMKTKWGSCNPVAGRLWLNLELAKKSPRCIEYIIVHELLHLLEPTHGDAFQLLMDRSLPQWRALRDELGAGQLGYVDWGT